MCCDRLYDIHRGNTADFILLLHAMGHNRTFFSGLVGRLQVMGQSYLALDLPGHGYAQEVIATDYQDIITYILSVLKTESIEKVVVVGHSFGGFVAQALCLQEPGRVMRVVLINSAYEISLRTLRALFVFPGFAVCTLINHSVWSLKGGGNPGVDFSNLSQHGDLYCVYLTTLATSKAAMKRTAHIMGSCSFLDDLESIHIPVVLVRGRHDQIFRSSVADTMCKRLPCGRIKTIDATHNVHTCWHDIAEILSSASNDQGLAPSSPEIHARDTLR